MGERSPTNPLLWLSEAQPREEGDALTGKKHESFKRAWKRLWSYAFRQLGDPAEADETLDRVAMSVARVGQRTLIRRTDAYLAAGVVREVRRLTAKSELVEYAGASHELVAFERAPEKDWVKELDDRVFMKEFLAAMDEESRVICHMWLRGDEWKEIASDLGCSVQHAKDKLRYAIESTKKRLLGPRR